MEHADVGTDVTIVTSWKNRILSRGCLNVLVRPAIRVDGPWSCTMTCIQKLHAKVYHRGASALIGSANLTHAGLGTAPGPNHEILVRVDLNDVLHDAMATWMQEGERMTAERVVHFQQLEALVEQKPRLKT